MYISFTLAVLHIIIFLYLLTLNSVEGFLLIRTGVRTIVNLSIFMFKVFLIIPKLYEYK